MAKITKDKIGNNIYPIEQSLTYISQRLDELTGNAIGNSYLKLDIEPIDLSGIETGLENVSDKLDKLNDSIESLSNELQSISQISETLENFLGWYISFNEKNKK